MCDSSFQEKLLRETDLTLEKCLELARATGLCRERIKTMTTTSAEQVNRLKLKENRKQDRDRQTDQEY